MRPNIHPGEILREEFLNRSDMTLEGLAGLLEVSVARLAGILAEREPICAETAIGLSRCFGTSERFWLELQMTYDLELARRRRAVSRSAGVCYAC